MLLSLAFSFSHNLKELAGALPKFVKLGVATWALLSTKLEVGGNIGFEGSGDVLATISQGAVTGGTATQNEGKTPMQQVNITSDGPSDSSSWAGLNLAFERSSKRLEISFSVTNNNTTENLKINLNIPDGVENGMNMVITTTELGTINPAIIAPNKEVTYNIIFIVGETNTTLNQRFELVFNLVNTSSAISEYLPEPTTEKLKFISNGDNTYTVAAANTSIEGDVVIPAKYEGLPVTKIQDASIQSSDTLGTRWVLPSGGFAYCNKITSIRIPYSITSIGSRALAMCNKLATVTIQEGVTSIGKDAFYNCSSLTKLTFAARTDELQIGNYAFNNTTSLQPAAIDFGGKTFTNTADVNEYYSNAKKPSSINDLSGKTWTIS